MSKVSDDLEKAIKRSVNVGDVILEVPNWLSNLGVKAGSIITSSERIGSDRNNKTDVIIHLKNSNPIKISAKLSNADYYGNWYGHRRFMEEFGNEAFEKLSNDITEWANNWLQNTSAPFVGVSICFGHRSGRTAREFTDIFSFDDIIKIVAGHGEGNHVANCLYVSSKHPENLSELISNLKPINVDTLRAISKNFKIAYRPINPITEYSNRGKNIYTKFEPYKRLDNLEIVESPKRLAQLGRFVKVEPNRINHNHVLKELVSKYNISIPMKSK